MRSRRHLLRLIISGIVLSLVLALPLAADAAKHLSRLGYRVWYDEFELTVGDSCDNQSIADSRRLNTASLSSRQLSSQRTGLSMN